MSLPDDETIDETAEDIEPLHGSTDELASREPHGSRLWRILLPPLLLAAAGLVAWVFVSSRPSPPQRPPQRDLPLVETAPVEATARRLDVSASGTVEPVDEGQLTAEVAGRVVWLSPRLLDGAVVADGEELLRIDDADYRAAVTSAAATVAGRRRQLAEERARAERQIAEWRAVSEGEPPELLRREPHLAAAEADLQAAAAGLEKARRDLARCRITAPYRARIVAEHVELGQQLAPGARLADLQGVAAVEVRLPLPLGEVLSLGLPLDGRLLEDGPAVELRSLARGDERRWQGRVTRCAARLDGRDRLLDVIVTVPQAAGREALLVGQFVSAAITGRRHEQVAELPAAALRGDDQVWLCRRLSDEERQAYAPPPAEKREPPGMLARLRMAMTGIDGQRRDGEPERPPLPDAELVGLQVEVLQRQEGRVFLRADWPADCPPVLLSRVIGAAEGMPVRLVAPDATVDAAVPETQP